MHASVRSVALVLGLIVSIAAATGCAKRPVVVDAAGTPVAGPAPAAATPAPSR